MDRFFDSIRQFYETAFVYCLKWLPPNNALLKHCRFINFNDQLKFTFDDRLKFTFDDVQEIISLFPTIYKDLYTEQSELDLVKEEFLLHQGLGEEEIPQSVWYDSRVYDKEQVKYHRMDILWAYLRKPLPTLSDIALSILTIPHSNVAEERCFSLIRKNNTEFRANLQLSGSLDSI